MPEISVIIPVYNAVETIGRTLDGVLAQSLREIEVVCVDDGSTDASAAILAGRAKADVRIAVVYLTSAVIWKVFRDGRLRLAAFAVAYLAMIFNPSHYRLFFLSDAMHMFPYFVFGLYLLNAALWRRLSVLLACGAFFLAVVFLEGNCWKNGMAFYEITRWQEMFLSAHGWLCFFGRTAVGLAGTLFLFGLFDRLLAAVPRLSCLAALGTTTLGVYALQIWPLARYGDHPPFRLPYCWAWIGTGVIFLLLHFAVRAIRSNRISRFVFFGDETLSARLFGLVKRRNK